MGTSRIKGITIEIGGDTTKLVSALSKVDNAISKSKQNIRDLDRALKLDPTNVELLKDRQQELGTEIKSTEEKIKAEKEALEQMKNTEGFDANSEAARNLKTQIDLDEAALKQLKEEAKSSASVMGSVFQAVGEKIQGIGDKISSMGKDLSTKITLPIVAGFATAIKTTGDFDASMSKVQATSGATAEDMVLLREKAKEMGETTKFSASESADALNYMAMAGWKTEDMLNGISGIMNLAAASGEELGTTSDIVTDALTAFGMQADESGRFADILASAASNANTNVSMMGESFKYVAPVAGAMGYSAEDVAVALGLMANAGIKADMAGTSLRNMMQRMAKPTKESANAMERLGIELYDEEGKMYSFREIMEQLRTSMTNINMPLEDYNNALDILDMQLEDGTLTQKKYESALEELNLQAFGAEGAEKARAAAMLGGARAMAGLLAISNATEADYNKLTSAIDNSSQAFAKLADGSVVPLNDALASGQEIIETFNGSAEAMANTMLDNVNGQMTILKSQLEALAISFGELLMPTVRNVVTIVQELVDKLNAMDDSQKETIIKIAAIAAAVGPLLVVIGTLISSIGTILTAGGALLTFLATPAGLIALIVAAIALLAVAIYQNWDAIKAWVQGVVIAIQEMATGVMFKLQDLKNKAIEAWEELKTTVITKVTELKDRAIALWEEIKTTVTTKVTELKTKVANLWENLKTSVKTTITNLKNEITTLWNNIKTFLTTTVSTIKSNITTAFDNIKNNIVNKITTAKNTIIDGMKEAADYIADLPDKFLEWGRDMIENLIDGIKSKISGVVDAVSGVASTIASYLHFSVPDKGPLADADTYMPDFIKLMTSGMSKGIPQLENAAATMANALNPAADLSSLGNSVSNTNTVNITVYGAEGQNVNDLADIIQDRINMNVYRNGAAFA